MIIHIQGIKLIIHLWAFKLDGFWRKIDLAMVPYNMDRLVLNLLQNSHEILP